MSARSKWKKCPHCNTSILRGDLKHEGDCLKASRRKIPIDESFKEAFDRAKPW